MPEPVKAEDLTMTVEGETTTPPSDSTSDSGNEPGIDWSSLSNQMEEDFDADQEPAAAPEPAQPEPEPEPTAAAPEPPPTQPAAPEPTAVVPEPEPVTATPPTEPPQAVAPTPEPVQAQPEQPPEATPEQIEQMRQGYIAQQATKYQLTEEQQNAFVTGNINQVLPTLAATLHANVLQEVTQQVANMMRQVVPTMVEQVTTQRETRQKGETEFFSQWPELAENRERVKQIVSAYRQLNPQASKEVVFRDAGIQAWMALGKPAADLAAKLAPQAPAAAPAAPPPVRPATPANPGGTSVAPAAAPSNPFTALSFEFEQEDFD